MDSKGIIIFVAVGIVAIWLYKSKSKKRVVKEQGVNELEANNSISVINADDKTEISIELDKIQAEHSTNLVNYFITLFAYTELDNQTDRSLLAETYPKTIGKQSINFTRLFTDYNATLVNECIFEKLNTNGFSNSEPETMEPFLKFELMIKHQAEVEARLIFDEFFKR